MSVRLIPYSQRAVGFVGIESDIDKLHDAMTEEQHRDCVGWRERKTYISKALLIGLHVITRQLRDLICVLRQVHYYADELKQEQHKMNGRIDFPNENRPGDVTKEKVTEALHQPDVRQQVSHEAKVLWLLDLHLVGRIEK